MRISDWSSRRVLFRSYLRPALRPARLSREPSAPLASLQASVCHPGTSASACRQAIVRERDRALLSIDSLANPAAHAPEAWSALPLHPELVRASAAARMARCWPSHPALRPLCDLVHPERHRTRPTRENTTN